MTYIQIYNFFLTKHVLRSLVLFLNPLPIEEAETNKIEWSRQERNKRLVQEVSDQPPAPSAGETGSPDDYWYGYRGDMKPKKGDDR